jgi:uncharacterized protein YjbI with pentapeptide repeats
VDHVLKGARKGTRGRSKEVRELLLLEYESGKREFVSLRLEGADLQGQDFRWVNFVQADLSRADLRDGQLVGSALIRGNLREARVAGADLRWSNLPEVDLTGADLRDAILKNVCLEGANLSNDEVTDQQLARAAFLRGATLPDGSVPE